MKLALLGGSFNPLHLGHLQVADELRAVGYDRIILVPANIPAHKRTLLGDDPELRLAMTRAGAEPYGFEVSDCEIRRGGVSYTVDTVAHVKDKYNIRGKVGLVIGEDLLHGFHSWRNYLRLLEEVDLLLAKRGCSTAERADIPYIRLENPDFPVSSTEIRERAGTGRPYRFLVPPEVGRFIREHGLYRQQAGEMK